MATNNDILPIYVLVGDDTQGYDKLMEERVIQKLKTRLSESGSDIDFDATVFDAETLDVADELMGAAETLPFLSEYRLIILRGAESAKKQIINSLIVYLGNPNRSTVLVVTSEKENKVQKLVEAARKINPKTIIKCAKKSKKETPEFVSNLAKGYGVSLNMSVANHLLAMVGADPVTIDTEIKKLSLYVNANGKKTVSIDDVDNVVTRSVVSKPWELADAVASRNLEQALTLLEEFGKDSVFAIMGICVVRLRELICAKTIQKRGSGSDDSVQSLFGGPQWKYKNHSRWASNYSSDELISALTGCVELEKSIKSGANAQDELFNWVVNTIRK